ncbi:LysR family transcriptional regulator, partial [Pseudomonas aeruginosa]
MSFTLAAIELCVTQAAVSHQVKSLEERLGVALFKRLPRGLMLTHEGESLLPVLCDSFDRIAGLLERFEGGHYRDVLTVGAVGAQQGVLQQVGGTVQLGGDLRAAEHRQRRLEQRQRLGAVPGAAA